jgi:hypothetical protein
MSGEVVVGASADHFLVIAHGDPAGVERVPDMLSQTAPLRLDHHRANGKEADGAS